MQVGGFILLLPNVVSRVELVLVKKVVEIEYIPKTIIVVSDEPRQVAVYRGLPFEGALDVPNFLVGILPPIALVKGVVTPAKRRRPR